MTISKNSQELNIEVDSRKIKITEKLILLGVEINDQQRVKKQVCVWVY